MLAVERKTKILELLHREKIATIETLAATFGVSEMTIRRDLEKCEKEGLVHRCHGGAVLCDSLIDEVNYADKNVANLDSKEIIAAYALQLTRPGDTIFLDAGTTTLRLATRLLTFPRITVVTNDLAIATLLSDKNPNAYVIILGGSVSNSLGSVHGAMAERMLEGLRIETAFVGGQAINEEFDLFSTKEAHVYLRRMVMRQANKTYLMVDKSKFYKQSLIRMNSLADYTGVITDKPIIEAEKNYLAEHNINLISLAGWKTAETDASSAPASLVS